MPQIIPIRDLKNTTEISRMCSESTEPIYITKNGYGAAVMMSIKVYEEMFVKMRAAALINESLDDIDNGGELIECEKFFSEIKRKHGR